MREADLADEDFIPREDGSGSRMLVEGLFEAPVLEPAVVMTTGGNKTIKQAVMAWIGLDGLSSHALGLELGLGLLTALDVEG